MEYSYHEIVGIWRENSQYFGFVLKKQILPKRYIKLNTIPTKNNIILIPYNTISFYFHNLYLYIT